MNPIVLIIAGIMIAVAALAAGLFYLYNKFQIVRDIVDTVGTVFKFVFTAIAAYVKWSFEMIKKEIEILATVFGWLWDRTEGLREGIVGIFSGIFDGIKGALRMGWNGLIGIINPIIKKLRSLPGLSWLPADGLPTWPGDQGSQREQQFRSGGTTFMAKGGIVTGPTNAIIGEAGPEAVIPLSRLNTGGNTYQITVNASPLSSPADVGSAVVDALKAYERRNGSLPLKVA